jgi:hypothetical protein
MPQQTVPGEDAQSGAPSHCQSVEPAIGHAVPRDTHVDGVPALSGGSQHCCPTAQKLFGSPGAALNGQKTPGLASGMSAGGGL